MGVLFVRDVPVLDGEVLLYVGGTTGDYISTELPPDCNFFDGDNICDHNTYTELTILHSDGSTLIDDSQACTTGRRLIEGNPYDEFGLHLLDSVSTDSPHCALTGSELGKGAIGRLYTTFNSSNGGYWNHGVHNYWDQSAQWLIGPGGEVVNVNILESTLDDELHDCITERISKWSFPRSDGDGVVRVNYPFNFSH